MGREGPGGPLRERVQQIRGHGGHPLFHHHPGKAGPRDRRQPHHQVREVFLKERRKLILVPRETPLSLIQIKNMELLTLAGAHIIPATPSFYGDPKTIEDLVDTVIARVYDHVGIDVEVAKRWRENIKVND